MHDCCEIRAETDCQSVSGALFGRSSRRGGWGGRREKKMGNCVTEEDDFLRSTFPLEGPFSSTPSFECRF